MVGRLRSALAGAIGLGMLLVAWTADAQVYRWVDANGVVQYTDREPQPSQLRKEPVAPRRPDPGEPPARSRAADATRPPARPPVPPRTIAGTPRGVPDAERRRASAIDELFRLLELSRFLTIALTPDGAGSDATAVNLAKFNPPYVGAARRSFRPYYVEAHAETALAWLRSPAARRMSEAIVADVSRAALEAHADPISPERRRVVARLARAGQYREIVATPISVIVLSLQFAMLGAMPQALQAAAPPSSDPGAALLSGLASGLGTMFAEGMKKATSRDALRSAVDAFVDEAGGDDHEVVERQLRYRLREIGDDDLVRAAQFLESPPGRWLGTAVRLASRDAAATMIADALKETRVTAK